MKKLISIIILLAMLSCTIIMAIPAAAEETETIGDTSYEPTTTGTESTTDPFADPFEDTRYYIPCPSDELYVTADSYLAEFARRIPAIGDIATSLVDAIPSEISELMTKDEFDTLGSERMTRVSGYPQSSSEYLDNCCIVKYREQFFILIFKTELNLVPVADGVYPTYPDDGSPTEKQYPVPCIAHKDDSGYSFDCKELIPAIGDIEISFVEEIPPEISEIITDEEIRILEEEGMVRVSGYPQSTDGLLDNCVITKTSVGIVTPSEGYYVLIYKTELGMVPYAVHYAGTWPGGVSPTETEPAPDETEKLPGTGGSEPVAAPKTVDNLALITAVLALSLTACAAVFTVVKEKSR